MSCENKLILTCILVDLLQLLHYYILQLLLGGNYSHCVIETVETEEIVYLHSEETARNMQRCGAVCAGACYAW